jgi:septum formation protein
VVGRCRGRGVAGWRDETAASTLRRKAAKDAGVTLPYDLLLASASPRRLDLLQSVGLRPWVQPADIDESPRADERPADYVRRIALDKANAALAARSAEHAGLPLLAADTIVTIDRRILGKPTGAEDAVAMLRTLAGRRHDVTTAYHIIAGETRVERAVTTSVNIRLIAEGEIAAYIASGEWEGKAGGYAIQGIAAIFATDIKGSFTNVVGLPLAEVVADLRAVGGLPGWPPAAFGVEARSA